MDPNYGLDVTVFALGVGVRGAGSFIQSSFILSLTSPSGIASRDTIIISSGTTLAAARVSGILAIALSRLGPTTPEALHNALKANALRLVTGQPDGTTYVLISPLCLCF